MEIIFATTNENKLKEIYKILGEYNFDIITLSDANINIDVVEDKDTFKDNAIKKATEIMEVSGNIVMADDSGIEIDYLDKKPGVESARFLGKDTEYKVKNKEILRLLDGVPKEKRTARFVTEIAVVFQNGETITTRGVLEGFIADELVGECGFGYDAIFYIEEYNKTLAEVGLDIKNKISHRGIALRKMAEKLKVYKF